MRRLLEIQTELSTPYGNVTEKSLLYFEKALLELP